MNIRHGDLALISIAKLPKELKETKTKVLMEGSHNNAHSIDTGKVYLKKVDDYVFGYLVAENTKLFHPEHSPKGVKIKDGVYELRGQQEILHEGMKPVID